MEDTVGKTIGSMKTSDKIIGLVLLTGVVSVLGYGLYWILPYLVEMAANTIYFVGELVVLAVLAMVFLDKNTWLNLYYGWQNLSRGIRRSIISSDPIGILSTVINRYAQKLEDIDANIVLADGATKRQRNTIAEAEKQRNMELNLAKAAEQQGKTLQIGLHANSAKRWDDSAEEMRPMLTVLENALVSMQRARDLCEVITKVANLDELNTIIVVTHDVTEAASISDTLWLMGRELDAQGNPLPGARMVECYDLAERDLCWHPDITRRPEFLSFVSEVKDRFTRL